MTDTPDRSAGRWCEKCRAHGNHHTDRHPDTTTTTTYRADAEAVLARAEQAAWGTWSTYISQADAPTQASRVIELSEKLDAVLALHPRRNFSRDPERGWCEYCDDNYPCPTVRAIEGEED